MSTVVRVWRQTAGVETREGAEVFHLQWKAESKEDELDMRSIYKLSNPPSAMCLLWMHPTSCPNATSSCGPSVQKYMSPCGTSLTQTITHIQLFWNKKMDTCTSFRFQWVYSTVTQTIPAAVSIGYQSGSSCICWWYYHSPLECIYIGKWHVLLSSLTNCLRD